MIIVDAATNKIINANPVAVELLGGTGGRLVGTTFPRGFDTRGQDAIVRLLASAREMGKSDDAKVRRESHDTELVASAALFRQDDGALYLVSLARPLIVSKWPCPSGARICPGTPGGSDAPKHGAAAATSHALRIPAV